MTHDELSSAGLEVAPEAHRRLGEFVAALLSENRHLNLIGAGTADEIWRVHVCDSLALLCQVRPEQAVRILDVGSGGGLPGLPLACVRPAAEILLLDAARKKINALGRIATRIGLSNVRPVWGRAETLAHDAGYRETFDLVTARALAPLAVLLEYAAGFVRPGGCCWLFKSAAAAATEVPAAATAALRCDLVQHDTTRYRLPGDAEDRVLIGYQKTGALDMRLPRPPGRARKRPL